jgi:hypothetical protein
MAATMNWHPARGDEICMDCKDPLDFYVQYPTSSPDVVDLVCLTCAVVRGVNEVGA